VVAATAGAQAAEIGVWIVENNLLAEVKLRFFEALRRDEELDVAGEELALTEQIRDRIRVRTRTGEGARFDLVRADNEVAIAARQVAIAKARIFESRALLRLAVGASLGETFKLAGDFYRSTPRADYAGLRDAVVASNPELKRAMAELARSEKLVDVERQQVLPGLSVRISQDNEPDLRTTRGGVALSVPMWDRRRGPIDEARAQVIRSRSDSDLRRFSLVQEFDAAWQRYHGVLGSVQALESGILREARTVVDIAEAAYRFGERGILEYLDARRQFRGIRVELISARYELYAALTELERLAARDVKGE
jgi:cobalt-zinc-cadmium efflux system outer membrane protein